MFSLSIAATYQIPGDLLREVAKKEKTFNRNPSSHSHRFELAMSYAYTGQIEKGWETLKKLPENYADTVVSNYAKAITQEPTEWKHHFKIAFGYYFKKDRNQAIQSFEQVLKIDPKNVWAMGFISLIKGEQGEVDEAIRLCKQALAIEPHATAIHFLLGEG